MSDSQNPEQPGQNLEPNQQQPGSPIKNMFQRMHERAQSQPQRTFTDEEYEQRDQQNPIIEESKRLGKGFLEILREVHRREYEVQGKSPEEIEKIMEGPDMYYKGFNTDNYTYVIQYDDMDFSTHPPQKIDAKDCNVYVQLFTPGKFSYSEENDDGSLVDFDMMPNFTTQIGVVPGFFIGNDGNEYSAVNEYIINPVTGFTQKIETISHKTKSDQSKLKRVDFSLGPREHLVSRRVDLQVEDYEHLRTLLSGIQTGEIK